MKRLVPIVSILVLLACKDDLVQDAPGYTDSFLFYTYLSVDGYPHSLYAGAESYTMYSSSSFRDSAYTLKSILADDSANPKNAIEVSIRSERLADPSDFTMASAMREGSIALADASGFVRNPDVYDFHFRPDTLQGHQAIYWLFDGQSYFGDSLNIQDINMHQRSFLNIEMTNSGVYSCIPSVYHRIQVDKFCKAQLLVNAGNPSSITASVAELIGVIKTVNWFVDDVYSGSAIELGSFSAPANNPVKIKAELIFESGCSEIIEKTVLPGRTDCDLHMTYIKEPNRKHNPKNFGTVEVVYFDDKGERYTSKFSNNEGRFSIESISDYNEGEEGYKRMLFTASDILLKHQSGATLKLQNFYGSLAFAYP